MERAYKHWTQEEKDYVFDVWGEISIKRIAKNIGKSYVAIERFAEKNKLGGVLYNDMYLTTVKASQIIGVDPTTVLAWVKNGQLKARKQTLRKKKVFLIDPKDFREFLRNNQDRWNATKLQPGFFESNVDWLIKKLDKDSNPVQVKSGKPWTIKEERLLLDYIKQGKTNKEIAVLLDRTVNSIVGKKIRLNTQLKEAI